MVFNDRPTCKDRHAAELILARSTRLHQRPNTLPQTCLLAQTTPCSRAADHTLSVLILRSFQKTPFCGHNWNEKRSRLTGSPVCLSTIATIESKLSTPGADGSWPTPGHERRVLFSFVRSATGRQYDALPPAPGEITFGSSSFIPVRGLRCPFKGKNG
jgi:hypothetical protein